MKKTNVIIAKALTIAMTAAIFGSSLPAQASTRNNETQIQQSNVKNGVLFEDSTYKISETSNSRTVLDKKTNHKVVLTFTNAEHTKGIYKDVNGKEKKFSKDAKGSVYLDDECVIEVNTKTTPIPAKTPGIMSPQDYWSPDYFFGSDGLTYYYVTSNTYDTKTQGDTESLALTILSAVPFVGPIYTLLGIIEGVRNRGSDQLFVVEEQYCTADYSHYAYKNYFYTDRGHTNLYTSNVVYKRMW